LLAFLFELVSYEQYRLIYLLPSTHPYVVAIAYKFPSSLKNRKYYIFGFLFAWLIQELNVLIKIVHLGENFCLKVRPQEEAIAEMLEKEEGDRYKALKLRRTHNTFLQLPLPEA